MAEAYIVAAARTAGGRKGGRLAGWHPADLAASVTGADIICCATGATEPLIRGEWLKPGQHLDLVGGFTPEMREAVQILYSRCRAECVADPEWFWPAVLDDLGAIVVIAVFYTDHLSATALISAIASPSTASPARSSQSKSCAASAWCAARSSPRSSPIRRSPPRLSTLRFRPTRSGSTEPPWQRPPAARASARA